MGAMHCAYSDKPLLQQACGQAALTVLHFAIELHERRVAAGFEGT